MTKIMNIDTKNGGVDIEGLKALLRISRKVDRGIILQTYIAEFGFIPDEHGKEIREILNSK